LEEVIRMIILAVIAILGVAVLGLLSKFALHSAVRRDLVMPGRCITWLEYTITLVVVALIVTPLVLFLGNRAAVAQALSYDELRSGVEVSAISHPNRCYAGHSGSFESDGESNCQYTYVSGSYDYEESYQDTTCSTDSSGKQSCTSVTRYRTESANIYTPYATVEYTYSTKYRISGYKGTVDYPGVYLAAHPVRASSRSIPGNIPRGVPSDWSDAKAHLDAGDPRPVTKVFTYKNYILASHDTMLAPFSADVARYRKKGLLPDHTWGIMADPIYGSTRPLAKKLSFVGVKVANEGQWQESLMRFNAALGSKLQGDLHVVIINSKLVDDPHEYMNALRAYWLSDHFGKRALAKNGIILVLGTRDNATVDWAQAATGMPFGNNTMIQGLETYLPGKLLYPDVIFGHPHTVITPAAKAGAEDKTTVTLSKAPGVLEDVMFGKDTAFHRPCMVCKGGGDVGYSNLVAKIQPSTGWKVWLVVIIDGISLPLWGVVGMTSRLEFRRGRNNRGSRSSRRGSRSYNPMWS
jgi:hypothetical protein